MSDSCASNALWIATLSRGGLTVPSEQFLRTVQTFELVFKEIHGDGLNTQYKVMETNIQIISSRFPTVPVEVVKKYVRTRTFIRIKHLNLLLKAEKDLRRNKRKLKHFTV